MSRFTASTLLIDIQDMWILFIQYMFIKINCYQKGSDRMVKGGNPTPSMIVSLLHAKIDLEI